MAEPSVIHVHVVLERLPRDIMDAPGGCLHVTCHCGQQAVGVFNSWHDAIPSLTCDKCKHRISRADATLALQAARDVALMKMRQKAAMS